MSCQTKWATPCSRDDASLLRGQKRLRPALNLFRRRAFSFMLRDYGGRLSKAAFLVAISFQQEDYPSPRSSERVAIIWSHAVRLTPCRRAASSIRARRSASKRIFTTTLLGPELGAAPFAAPAMNASAFSSDPALGNFTSDSILMAIVYPLCIQRIHKR
jgi:hypothetical protein